MQGHNPTRFSREQVINYFEEDTVDLLEPGAILCVDILSIARIA